LTLEDVAQLSRFESISRPSWAANFAAISAKWLTSRADWKLKPDALLAEPDQSSYACAALLALHQQLFQHGCEVPKIRIARDSVALDFNDGHTSYCK
jgi:hypothetical protein